MILSPDHGATDAALGGVVVERDARIAQKTPEPVPVGDDVRRGVSNGQRLENGLLPEPSLPRGDHRSALGAPELGSLIENPLGALVDGIEFPDPLERELRLGVVGRSFLEFPVDVGLILRTG